MHAKVLPGKGICIDCEHLGRSVGDTHTFDYILFSIKKFNMYAGIIKKF
jgi:hypothetical protein